MTRGNPAGAAEEGLAGYWSFDDVKEDNTKEEAVVKTAGIAQLLGVSGGYDLPDNR